MTVTIVEASSPRPKISPPRGALVPRALMTMVIRRRVLVAYASLRHACICAREKRMREERAEEEEIVVEEKENEERRRGRKRGERSLLTNIRRKYARRRIR